MSDARDRERVRRCLGGDPEAFAELVETYQRPLFNAALRLVRDFDDASDVTQIAFLKAYEKLDTYDPRYRFFSWIYRIVINEGINLLKRRKPSEPLEEVVAGGLGPDQDYAETELGERIQEGMMSLSIDYRIVLVLKHFLGHSYTEISELLGIPEKTVKSRLFTARRQLGDALLSLGTVKS
jgi:RNA polymerase sigma-70 factor (ECF subfamily)